MADYWTTPKINWVDSDGIGYEDLNRMERNISANRDANYRKVQGFGFLTASNIVGEDGVINVSPGSCYSASGVPIRMDANHIKNLETWAAGNGVSFGGMAPGASAAAHTWYYIFVITDPTNGDTELMFDDNPAGTNVTNGIYTEKRYIGSFKTASAGGDGGFDLVEMYAIGDQTFINPNSMYADRKLTFTNTAPNNNKYNLITITDTVGSEGFALPARDVRAEFSLFSFEAAIGLVSGHDSVFTVPTDLITATLPDAEFYRGQIFSTMKADIAIMITAARQINLAMFDAVSDIGYLEVVTLGFHDERLL